MHHQTEGQKLTVGWVANADTIAMTGKAHVGKTTLHVMCLNDYKNVLYKKTNRDYFHRGTCSLTCICTPACSVGMHIRVDE